MPKLPKVRSLHIFAISPEKRGDKVDFLPADKHQRFLQNASIILGVCPPACLNYPKKQVFNIFAIS